MRIECRLQSEKSWIEIQGAFLIRTEAAQDNLHFSLKLQQLRIGGSHFWESLIWAAQLYGYSIFLCMINLTTVRKFPEQNNRGLWWQALRGILIVKLRSLEFTLLHEIPRQVQDTWLMAWVAGCGVLLACALNLVVFFLKKQDYRDGCNMKRSNLVWIVLLCDRHPPVYSASFLIALEMYFIDTCRDCIKRALQHSYA